MEHKINVLACLETWMKQESFISGTCKYKSNIEIGTKEAKVHLFHTKKGLFLNMVSNIVVIANFNTNIYVQHAWRRVVVPMYSVKVAYTIDYKITVYQF